MSEKPENKKSLANWLRSQSSPMGNSKPSLQSDLTLGATALFFIGPIVTLSVLLGFKETVSEFMPIDDIDQGGVDFDDENETRKAQMVIKAGRGIVGLAGAFGAVASGASGPAAATAGLKTAAMVAMFPSAITMGLSVALLAPLTLLLAAKYAVKKYDSFQQTAQEKTGPQATPSNSLKS